MNGMLKSEGVAISNTTSDRDESANEACLQYIRNAGSDVPALDDMEGETSTDVGAEGAPHGNRGKRYTSA